MNYPTNKKKGVNHTKNVWFYPFFFNGKEKDYESGFHYYGARYYWSELLTGWLSVDPMADKFPSLSPYNYCEWNPVKLVDPEGDSIKLAENSSDAFREQFLDAIQYLSDNGASDIYESINKRTETIYIEELSYEEAYKTQFVPSEKKILWCPTAAILTTEGVMLSPTISLNHEMDHCLERLEHPETQSRNYTIGVFGYRNAEEQRVITGSEQRTALKLGEIKTGQVTRQDHLGTIYETECSTSNAPKYPNQPIVKPLSNRLNTIKVKPKE